MRKKVPIAVACAIGIATLVTPVESLASRKRPTPIPSPPPVLVQEPSTPVINWPEVALLLFTLSVALGAWVYCLRAELSAGREESEQRIKDLEKELCDSRAECSDRAAKASEYREKVVREQERLFKKEMELSKVCEKLRSLKSRIEDMIQVDPEIEVKVAKLVEAQSQAEAEKKARKEAEAAQRKIQAEGQAQINELLTEMKRGY